MHPRYYGVVAPFTNRRSVVQLVITEIMLTLEDESSGRQLVVMLSDDAGWVDADTLESMSVDLQQDILHAWDHHPLIQSR